MTSALPYSTEDLQELQSQPIFLSQFLNLTLPRIRTLSSSSNSSSRPSGPTSQASKNSRAYFGTSSAPSGLDSPPSSALLSALPKLQLAQWPAFLSSIHTSLSTLQGGEHILPPPAFRVDDLPIATLLPTVFLWVIVAVWQPCLRMYELDEFHISARTGGDQDTEEGRECEQRRELKAGDHLPEHEELPWASGQEGVLPRQVFYTVLPSTTRDRLVPPGDEEDKEFRGIKALISVEEPWKVDLTLLDLTSISTQEILDKLQTYASQLTSSTQSQEDTDGGRNFVATATYAALLSLLSSLQASKVTFGVLTNYDIFLFIKVGFSPDDGKIDMLELSPPVRAGDSLQEGKSTTVFAAMWYFGLQIVGTGTNVRA